VKDKAKVELRRVRGQDPALGRDESERVRIKEYRKAVESAAAGKLGESFERLDKIGSVVTCGLGEQADKLADEYVSLAQQNASVVVISQTRAEVYRVNLRVRDALKAKFKGAISSRRLIESERQLHALDLKSLPTWPGISYLSW
jgi:hypothetical protein